VLLRLPNPFPPPTKTPNSFEPLRSGVSAGLSSSCFASFRCALSFFAAVFSLADGEGLRLLEFIDRRATERELSILRKRLRMNVVPGEHRYLTATGQQLADYFSGNNLEFDIPLAPVGSAFQLRAWKILQSIPVGETRSYSWMAKRLGDENARRAVGRANGTNMICIVIPCHRVIRADGTLCGYGGGLWRKKWLLDHERKLMSDN